MHLGKSSAHWWVIAAVVLLCAGIVTLATEAKTAQYRSHPGIGSQFAKATKMSDDRTQTEVVRQVLLVVFPQERLVIHSAQPAEQSRPLSDFTWHASQLRAPPVSI